MKRAAASILLTATLLTPAFLAAQDGARSETAIIADNNHANGRSVRKDEKGRTVEEYRRNGKLHRADGPAVRVLDPETGLPSREEYWRDGKRDRRDGYAVIDYDKTGKTVVAAEAWRNGIKIEPTPKPEGIFPYAPVVAKPRP